MAFLERPRVMLFPQRWSVAWVEDLRDFAKLDGNVSKLWGSPLAEEWVRRPHGPHVGRVIPQGCRLTLMLGGS